MAKEPAPITPEELTTLKTVRVQLALSRVFVACILAYGAYDFWKNPNPLGPIIFGIAAWAAHCMRPILPDGIRDKLKPD